MMNYSLLSENDRIRLAPELVNQGHVLVTDGKVTWVVKHKPHGVNEEKRDMLAYSLGKNIANVAEIKLLNQDELVVIKQLSSKGDNSTTLNTFLVKLGGSYVLDELSCKTLEEAVAMELVYSLLIRRRDTHANNRCYLNGVPIFFDHQTAFLGDHGLEDINFFFSRKDEGHAGAWRVKQSRGLMTTIQARQQGVDNHWVNNLDEFSRQIEVSVEKLISVLTDDIIRDTVESVGFTSDEAQSIQGFLETNKKTLAENVELMRQVITQE